MNIAGAGCARSSSRARTTWRCTSTAATTARAWRRCEPPPHRLRLPSAQCRYDALRASHATYSERGRGELVGSRGSWQGLMLEINHPRCGKRENGPGEGGSGGEDGRTTQSDATRQLKLSSTAAPATRSRINTTLHTSSVSIVLTAESALSSDTLPPSMYNSFCQDGRI
jgi:hypothetical protein